MSYFAVTPKERERCQREIRVVYRGHISTVNDDDDGLPFLQQGVRTELLDGQITYKGQSDCCECGKQQQQLRMIQGRDKTCFFMCTWTVYTH